MRRTSLNLFLVFVLLASGAFAQQQRRAEDAPSAERLRAHVTYLASGKLEGRKTGARGAEKAARYIAREFERAGLRAAPPSRPAREGAKTEAGYLRSFPYVASVEAADGNALYVVSGRDARAFALRLKDDFMPLGFSASAKVERAAAVFVGYGIAASEYNHDDYAGVDVRDKVAVALSGTPGGDNDPHNALARYNSLRFKASAARERGAKALIVVAREENFQDDRLARLRYDNAGDAGLPVVAVSRASARRIFQAGNLKLEELETSPRAPNESRRNLSAPLEGVTISVSTNLVRKAGPAFNVVGVAEGSDPKLRQEVIVVGAHYDHLGRGGESSLAAREGDVHHGADDNASGTSALIELARLLARERARRTVVFVAFGGEEEGLLGSNYYVNHPAFPLEQTVAMINMDMVGRLREDKLFVSGVGTAEEWRGWLAQLNEALDVRLTLAPRGGSASSSAGEMPVVRGADGRVVATTAPRVRFQMTYNEDGYGPSDHSSFYARKIPVLFFFTGPHEDYHKPSDTAERINYEGLSRVVSFVRDALRAVDSADKRPTYIAVRSQGASRGTGFRVYLGTIPSYADSTDGLRLDAVRDDSPASRAGLRAGDRIVRLAGRDIRNVYDYTNALSQMKPNQQYDVEVLRDGQRLQLKITPAPRR